MKKDFSFKSSFASVQVRRNTLSHNSMSVEQKKKKKKKKKTPDYVIH